MFGASATLALMAARNDTELRRLAYAVTIDSLTELFNRTYFDGRLHQEIERARRHSSSLTLLMADVDDFQEEVSIDNLFKRGTKNSYELGW